MPTAVARARAAVPAATSLHSDTRQGSPPLPPGPKGWPLNFKLIGQSFVILNDRVIAAELLNKKVNADRPLLHMANLSGWESVLSSARYGSRFRAYRKLIAQVIGNRTKMENFYPTLEYQANMFLKRVLSNPEGFDMVGANL
ncbi:hypothetical protein R3P38DRAFT_3114081 [Favolaschia claudopus]|uniref:Cytochrome P450 n=1 Tax=Favolaschia claudopus TaxID=2862362 RepID=A0AAV9ZHZ8_9AGAR